MLKFSEISSSLLGLVLLWSYLLWLTTGSSLPLSIPVAGHLLRSNQHTFGHLWVAAAVLSNWVADIYVTRYRLVQASAVLLCLGTVVVGTPWIFAFHSGLEVITIDDSDIANDTFVLGAMLMLCGSGVCLANVVPLANTQLSGESGDTNRKFIHLFILTIHAGSLSHYWFYNTIINSYIREGYFLCMILYTIPPLIAFVALVAGRKKCAEAPQLSTLPATATINTELSDTLTHTQCSYWEKLFSTCNIMDRNYFSKDIIEDSNQLLQFAPLALSIIASCMAANLSERGYEHLKQVSYVEYLPYNRAFFFTHALLTSSNTWAVLICFAYNYLRNPLRNMSASIRMATAAIIVVVHCCIIPLLDILGHHYKPINSYWKNVLVSFLSAAWLYLGSTSVLEIISNVPSLRVRNLLSSYLFSLCGLCFVLANYAAEMFTVMCDTLDCWLLYYVCCIVLALVGMVGCCYTANHYRKPLHT